MAVRSVCKIRVLGWFFMGSARWVWMGAKSYEKSEQHKNQSELSKFEKELRRRDSPRAEPKRNPVDGQFLEPLTCLRGSGAKAMWKQSDQSDARACTYRFQKRASQEV